MNIVPIIMVFLGALLTGTGTYSKLASFGGAGTVVPITGFSNAVVAPAIEFKKEGYIFGVAAKMFESLYNEGVNINMISTSEIRVTVLINEKDGVRAMNAVHDAFGLAD